MKTSCMFIAFIFALFLTTPSVAQDLNRETVKVWGNCGMCKKNIETAALAAGAEEADWNIKKKKLTVGYNPAKTNMTAIQKAVAEAGYDTKDMTASQEAYDKLHSCCKYDRKDAAGKSSGKAACCADEKSCKHLGDCAGKDCCKNGKACTDHKACEASGCCSAKASCSHDKGKGACCADEKSCKHLGDCAGKDCCKNGKPCKDHKACEASGCCSAKASCNHDHAQAACCKEGQACTDHKACTEKGCCKDKSCCKS